MRVGDICTPNPVCVRRDATMTEAARTMRTSHVGVVVVVEDRDGGRVPVGMLTDRDVVVAVLAAAEHHFGLLAACEVMAPRLITADEDEDTALVLRRMRASRVRRVPVLDAAGHLFGVLSVDDIVAALSLQLQDVAAIIAEQRVVEQSVRP